MPEMRSQKQQEAEARRTCQTCGLQTKPRLHHHHSPASWIMWSPEPAVPSGSVFLVFISLSLFSEAEFFPQVVLYQLSPQSALPTGILRQVQASLSAEVNARMRVCVSALLCLFSALCPKSAQRFKPLQ